MRFWVYNRIDKWSYERISALKILENRGELSNQRRYHTPRRRTLAVRNQECKSLPQPRGQAPKINNPIVLFTGQQAWTDSSGMEITIGESALKRTVTRAWPHTWDWTGRHAKIRLNVDCKKLSGKGEKDWIQGSSCVNSRKIQILASGHIVFVIFMLYNILKAKHTLLGMNKSPRPAEK
jgi:hypothetical protein